MGASAAPGKYTARREARGDVTDTAPRLDAWAFFDDSKPTPLGLTVLVDTFAARTALDTGLLPLVVGLGYEDTGPKLPVRPWTFELSWDGGATRGLSFEELRGVEGWQSALNRHQRLLAKRPRPYDGSTATLIDVSFYPDPPMSTWRSEDAKLSPGAAFADLLYFELPEGVDPWTTLFTITHVPSAPAPEGVTARPLPPSTPSGATGSAAFRIEPDTEVHQRAFRHARKARK